MADIGRNKQGWRWNMICRLFKLSLYVEKMNEMGNERKSVFRRGADDGFYFGIYLTILFFSMIYSFKVPLLGLVSTIMIIVVPVITYKFLRRYFIEEQGTLRFSVLWMHGIVIFFCGSLILAIVSYVFMRWIQPDIMLSQVQYLIEVYRDSGWARGEEFAGLLEEIIDKNMLPSAISVSMEMVWLGTFSGSLLSMLISLLVMSRRVKSSDKRNINQI